MERARTQSTRVLNLALCGIGALMIVVTLVRGGGPLALGVVLGVLFLALGAARLRLLSVREGAPDRR